MLSRPALELSRVEVCNRNLRSHVETSPNLGCISIFGASIVLDRKSPA